MSRCRPSTGALQDGGQAEIVMAGLTLDAGALIAFERNNRWVVALIARSLAYEHPVAVPPGVVGQVWRDGRRQARLARRLASDKVTIEPLDDRRAREAGQICGVSRTSDVVDASVILCARARRHGSERLAHHHALRPVMDVLDAGDPGDNLAVARHLAIRVVELVARAPDVTACASAAGGRIAVTRDSRGRRHV
jgi:hypothetical protein